MNTFDMHSNIPNHNCLNYITCDNFCDDIWKIIIEYIMSSHYCIKCTTSYYDNWQIKNTQENCID